MEKLQDLSAKPLAGLGQMSKLFSLNVRDL